MANKKLSISCSKNLSGNLVDFELYIQLGIDHLLEIPVTHSTSFQINRANDSGNDWVA